MSSGKRSRDKGARGEREFWAWLRAELPQHAHRFGRNHAQAEKGGADSTTATLPFVFEIKHHRAISRADSLRHFEQAVVAAQRSGDFPVLAFKEDYQRGWRFLIGADFMGRCAPVEVPDYVVLQLMDDVFNSGDAGFVIDMSANASSRQQL